MKKSGLTNLDRLLALPNMHLKGGKPYVRVNYKNLAGKWRAKEKQLSPDTPPEKAVQIIASIQSKVMFCPSLIDGERMTFGELLSQYQLAHPGLKEWYAEPLQVFANRKIRSLFYADMRWFKEAREAVTKANGSHRKPATINRELEILRSVLLFAVRHGWLDRNPFAAGPSLIIKSEEDRRNRIPTPKEEARLLAVCVPPREHLRGLIIATRDTGLRRGALLGLEWQMVDWERQVLIVPRGNRYKRRPSMIGLTDRLRDELRRVWRERNCPAEGKIFNVVADFKRSYKTACRLADIEGLRFNDLRHGFATDLMEADIPKRLAMKISGHNNAETHEIYVNVDERLARQVADALNRLHAGRIAGEDESQSTTELPQ